jgi:hypothetical protein
MPNNQPHRATRRRRPGKLSLHNAYECAQHHMGRRLDWRWYLAISCKQLKIRIPNNFPDHWVQEAVRFLKARSSGHWVRLSRRGLLYDEISTAFQFHELPSRNKLLVQCHLLANTPTVAIAEALDMPGAVINAYEAIFYSVRDRLQYRAWIVNKAIGIDLKKPLNMPEMMKLFAYFSGISAALMVHEAFLESEISLALQPQDTLNPTRVRLKQILCLMQHVPLWHDFRFWLRVRRLIFEKQPLIETKPDAKPVSLLEDPGFMAALEDIKAELGAVTAPTVESWQGLLEARTDMYAQERQNANAA